MRDNIITADFSPRFAVLRHVFQGDRSLQPHFKEAIAVSGCIMLVGFCYTM